MRRIAGVILTFLFLFTGFTQTGTAVQTNYDESKVPAFQLPDPLLTEDGSIVSDPRHWPARRKEILELFKQHVYGNMPSPTRRPVARAIGPPTRILENRGLLHRLELDFFGDRFQDPIQMLLFLPKQDAPAPVFLAYNFRGNHSVFAHPDIQIGQVYDPKKRKLVLPEESSRGSMAHRWDVERIISAGYGLATLHYGDIDPDFDDRFQNGVHSQFPELQNRDDNWTSIGAWAWGLSRVLDHLETVPAVDAKRVVVMGHSRLGKTSLWAGATDERFAAVISNNSGCGGAALARRQFGETVKKINTTFPHWFCRRHKTYNDAVNQLPVDQHMLISLIAPRPVYVASAVEDRWADPKGEFLSCFHAQGVYRLLGQNPGLPESLPELDRSVGDRMGYHIRTGKHDVTAFDWEQYVKFAVRHPGSPVNDAGDEN